MTLIVLLGLVILEPSWAGLLYLCFSVVTRSLLGVFDQEYLGHVRSVGALDQCLLDRAKPGEDEMSFGIRRQPPGSLGVTDRIAPGKLNQLARNFTSMNLPGRAKPT